MAKYEISVSGRLYVEAKHEAEAVKQAKAWAYNLMRDAEGSKALKASPENIVGLRLEADKNHALYVESQFDELMADAQDYERKKVWPYLSEKLLAVLKSSLTK